MKMIRRNVTCKCAAIVLSLVMAFTIFPVSADAETGNGDEVTSAEAAAAAMGFEPGQLIVVTENKTSKRQMKSIAKEVDGQLDTMSSAGDGSKVALVDVEEGSELTAAAELESEDKVLYVQPNYIYELDEGETETTADEPEAASADSEADADDQAADPGDVNGDAADPDADIDAETDEPEAKDDSTFPNDQEYGDGNQKYLIPPLADGTNAGTVNAKGAWDQLEELGATNKPLVAVVDTGAYLDHEDLQYTLPEGRLVTFNGGEEMGFYNGDEAGDDHGHGTRVTSIIFANTDNNIGIAGVAANRADMMVIDILTPDKKYTHSIDIAKGIDYAVDHNAKLISISLGAFRRDYVCEDAVKNAWTHGSLCICSAGNDNTQYMHYPGDSPYVITVMSHSVDGTPASDTCYGIEKDISAPGVSLKTADIVAQQSYYNFSGTSGATPVAAGSAALLLAAKPDLTPRQIKNLLYTSSGKESFSPEKSGHGFGMINVDTAMQNLLAAETDPEKIVFNKHSIQMLEKTETSIEYAVYPGNTSTTDVAFTSSDENVATVDGDGIVKAKAPGSATITASCGGVSEQCEVTVSETPYITIDKKPYCTENAFASEELTDSVKISRGGVINEYGYYYHQYRIDLEENETISAVMSCDYYSTFLRIKDENGSIVKSGNIGDLGEYSSLTYTAKNAGTYQLQATQIYKNTQNPYGQSYDLRLASDKGFCEPEVTSIDENKVMHMSWPAVDGANYYRVRKYADKDLTELEFEKTVNNPEFADSDYDDTKVNYYTVTSFVQTKAGDFANGETPFVVKMENPMTVKGKTYTIKRSKLKRRSVTLSRTRVLSIQGAQGTRTYTKVSGNKRITIYKTTGKIKVKKGLKKGKHKVRVNVTAAGNDDYNPISITVTFTIRVK